MILKTLEPGAFGRFQNAVIPLQPGINLIEAPNEAGKTTLAAFISGMLYGFFKRDVKRRIYAPEYDRYLPWDNPGRYLGAMEFLHEGRAYRLERNFLKDEVKLLDAATRSDESERMDYNQALRIREPGLYFLGISQTAFEGTLYVRQQAVRSDDALGAELSDRIDALSETGTGGLSASGAAKWLDARRAELGTPRRSGTPLGEQQKKLTALLSERQESEKRRGEAAEDARRELALKKEIEALEAAQREDEMALEGAKRHARWKRAETARAYKEEIGRLEAALRAMPEDGSLHEEALEQAIEDARSAQTLARQAESLFKDLSDLDGEIAAARAQIEHSGLTEEARALSGALERSDARMTLLESDLKARDEAVSEILGSLPPEPAVDAQRARMLIARFDALPQEKPDRWMVAAGAILLLSALLGFLHPTAFALAAPAALLIALGVAKNLRSKKTAGEKADILKSLGASSPAQFDAVLSALEERACAEQALDAARHALRGAESALEEATGEFSALLERAGMDSLEDYRRAVARYDAALAEARALSARRDALARQADNAAARRDGQAEAIRRILTAAGLDADAGGAPEALNARLKQLRDRGALVRTLEGERRLLAECLGGDDYDALTSGASPEQEPVRDAGALAHMIEQRAGEILKKKIEMNRHAAEREAIENGCRTLPDIDGEIALSQEKMDALTRRAEAIDLAKARIEEAAAAMRKKLSPALGRAIAEVSGQVTSGRYARLYIDTDLIVRAEASGQTVSPDRLSGGTADAIYLALRLGLIEFLMGEKPCPVILDDSLAQLDDERAARMLRVIADFAEGRQALLFTCQSRTRRMLEDLLIPHHAVALDR